MGRQGQRYSVWGISDLGQRRRWSWKRAAQAARKARCRRVTSMESHYGCGKTIGSGDRKACLRRGPYPAEGMAPESRLSEIVPPCKVTFKEPDYGRARKRRSIAGELSTVSGVAGAGSRDMSEKS